MKDNFHPIKEVKKYMKQEPIIIKTLCQDFRVHQLKTVEPYYSAVECGDKTFEVRKFDRDYQGGDVLQLIKYDPETNTKGDYVLKRITYVLSEQPYAPEGYVILGINDEEDLEIRQFQEGLFEVTVNDLLYKWFHGMADDEINEFEGVLELLLAKVRNALY